MSDDFDAYVAARWPGLVRGLVEQGATPAEAHDRAAEALSRARRHWAGEHRDGDVEALVEREVAAVWRPRAVTGSGEVPVLVLAPPTTGELDARTRRRRTTTAKRTAAVLLPLALVAAGLAWWTARGAPPETTRDELGAVRVQPAVNPLPLPWYDDGALHLGEVVLEVDGLTDLVALGDAAAYADTAGRVVRVEPDGTRTLLGHTEAGAAVVGADSGLVAWVDPRGEAPRLVVADGAEEVAALAVDPGSRVVAVDGRTVYFRDQRATHAWLPDGDTVAPVTPADLVDVRGRVRAFQLGPAAIKVVESAFDVAHDLPGNGARLSPDGDTVATRLDTSGYGRLALYDTATGREVRSGLTDTDVALAVALGRGRTATYVVARAADMSRTGPFLREFTGGDLVVRHCELAPVSCVDAVTLPDATAVPVLAR